jgi:hypothetical protein
LRIIFALWDKHHIHSTRFAFFLCVIAVFQLMGGHWVILQATAWVGMLVKYSEAEGVEVGISKTFDGKHPCDLCLSIAKKKQTEKKQSTQLDASKIYLVAQPQHVHLGITTLGANNSVFHNSAGS